MTAVEDRFARLMLVLVPACIVIVGCGASLLPHRVVIELVEFLAVWLSLSLLVGVVAGHCMLSESDWL
jgi:hypothetical protein